MDNPKTPPTKDQIPMTDHIDPKKESLVDKIIAKLEKEEKKTKRSCQ